jgi:hypothetical protein
MWSLRADLPVMVSSANNEEVAAAAALARGIDRFIPTRALFTPWAG